LDQQTFRQIFPHSHAEREELLGWNEIPENMHFSKMFQGIQELPSSGTATRNYYGRDQEMNFRGRHWDSEEHWCFSV
jgi:hypothetical protein